MCTESVPNRCTKGEWLVAGAGLVTFVVLMAAWMTAALGDPDLAHRDWAAFDGAATRAAHGRWAEAYLASAAEQYPFLYPPFVLWLVLPLAAWGPAGSYAAVVAAGLAATAAALMALRVLPHLRRLRGSTVAAVAAVAACAAPTLLVVITGQLSPLYLLGLCGGLALHERGRPATAGAALALLAVKPNLAVVAVAFLLARRSWRALAGFTAAVGALIASTAPFGAAPWTAFVHTLDTVADREVSTAVSKAQVTLLAALRWITNDGHGHPVASALWVAAAAGLGWLAWRGWRSRPSATMTLRWWGTVALLAVAANWRLYYYDALLLLLPAVAWYLERGSYTSPVYRRLVGGAVVLSNLCLYGVVFDRPLGVLAGPVTAAWLVLEVMDQRRGRADLRTAAAGRAGAGAATGPATRSGLEAGTRSGASAGEAATTGSG